jgi:hypothetical protein
MYWRRRLNSSSVHEQMPGPQIIDFHREGALIGPGAWRFAVNAERGRGTSVAASRECEPASAMFVLAKTQTGGPTHESRTHL